MLMPVVVPVWGQSHCLPFDIVQHAEELTCKQTWKSAPTTPAMDDEAAVIIVMLLSAATRLHGWMTSLDSQIGNGECGRADDECRDVVRPVAAPRGGSVAVYEGHVHRRGNDQAEANGPSHVHNLLEDTAGESDAVARTCVAHSRGEDDDEAHGQALRQHPHRGLDARLAVDHLVSLHEGQLDALR